MADYAEMYKALFQATTCAIDILQKAQQATEEMYLSCDEAIIRILPTDNTPINEEEVNKKDKHNYI